MSVAKICLEYTTHPQGWGVTETGERCPYRVSRVEQSVAYSPGQYLTRSNVAALCEATGIWRVVIEQEKLGRK